MKVTNGGACVTIAQCMLNTAKISIAQDFSSGESIYPSGHFFIAPPELPSQYASRFLAVGQVLEGVFQDISLDEEV
ncbi:MAG TPA: hypothetical protein VKT75_04150 [Acidobacteriaceae bacterium]|nr:hypothetical protein [Acidobacteriaceae bacterium]